MFCFPVSVKAPVDNQSEPSIQLDLLREVVDSVVDFARKFAAKQPATESQIQPPPQVVPTEAQRIALAKDPYTPAAWLESLSLDASGVLRQELLFNPSLPFSALRRLAADDNRFIASQARALLGRAA